MIRPHTAKAENSTNDNILEAELFFIIIRYCEKHFFSMSNNNFCDAFEASINAHQSAKTNVDFAIAEVVRKNFTANISSKNTPVQELRSERGWALTRPRAFTLSNTVNCFSSHIHVKILVVLTPVTYGTKTACNCGLKLI